MPGFDRKGPNGMGSRTGRGMGYCSPADSSVGFGFGFGRGFGRGGAGRGLGRGMGRGMGYGLGGSRNLNNLSPIGYFGAARYEDVYPRQDELQMLKDEASYMEERVNGIKERIAELEAPEGDKN
ncbi:MAG: DUF5320 domain-containing protein [Spirochaetales bacterium]|nr:DUF5320 domain-containing protein [Spirochaetales bacterium]